MTIPARAVGQEEILSRVVQVARQVVGADAAALYLLDDDGACLTMAATSGLPAALQRREPVALEGSPLDANTLSGQPALVTDVHTDPRAANTPGDYRSVVCVPLMYENTPLGALHVYAVEPRSFDADDAARLTSLADLGAAGLVAVRALAEAADQEASKAQFIHVATHELRSPLATAQSLVRGVLKGYAGPLSDQQADLFARISRRLDFLESLVNDLLELAAGKAAGADEEVEPVLLNASVGRAVLLIQPRAEEKGVALTLRPCRDRLVAQGTEDGLDRIFVNLVGNAVKYTPSGGSVTATLCSEGDDVRVTVADTGIGVPEESLPHLFQEFYRAPNAKASNEVGTGLGLAIVKDLVERYGGRIEVQSRVGQGTTFTVSFPLVDL